MSFWMAYFIQYDDFLSIPSILLQQQKFYFVCVSYFNPFIYWWICRLFYLLDIVIWLHFSVILTYSFGYIFKNGIFSHNVFLFSVFWETSILIFIVTTQVYILPPKQWIRGLLSPNPQTYFFRHWFFLITATPTRVKWNPKAILICISLMVKDVENFYKCLFVICISMNLIFPLISSVAHWSSRCLQVSVVALHINFYLINIWRET